VWVMNATQALRDFLMQCFQKDCNLRVSAAKLLRHPWLQKNRPKEAAVQQNAFCPAHCGRSNRGDRFGSCRARYQGPEVAETRPTRFNEAVETVKQWNEALQGAA